MSRPGEVVALAPERARRRAERQARVTFQSLTSPEMQAASNAARLLYVILTTYLNYETGEGWVSWGTLARAMGTSRSRVRVLAAELIERGLVDRFSRGQTERGEDEESGWRLIAPGSPGVREDDPRLDEGRAGEHRCTRPQAHPGPPASSDPDPDPAPPIPIPDPHTLSDVRTEAEALVTEFHAARGVEQAKALRSETKLAARLIREHGVVGARGIVRYALGKIRSSWREAATFGAVGVYVDRAVAEGAVERERRDEEQARRVAAIEAGLDRGRDPPAGVMAGLVAAYGEETVVGLSVEERWRFADAAGIVVDYLERRLADGEPECRCE